MTASLERFFSGFAFPAFSLLTLALFTVLLATVTLVPSGADALGAFANQFRVWCFGVDPATGGMRTSMVVATFSELLLFMAVLLLVWQQPLRQQWKQQRAAFIPCGGAAVFTVVGLGFGFVLLAEGPVPADPTVFPARELRTVIPPPRFALVDQDGTTISLEGLRGRVVVVTAVYASCGLACPRILGQMKAVAATLSDEERAGLTVLGITLDPQRDDREQLARMARAQRVETPLYHLLTGEPLQVEAALDRLGFTRRRDPETGVIDHANLFLVVDRKGLIAYRFTLDPLQEQWMGQALRLLLAEPVELAWRE